MGYAIRNDQQGWRSVDGPDDVGPDEYFSETPVEITPPTPTYKQALDLLNIVYQTDVAKLNSAFALALLSDGPSEATKIAAIRTQYEARKTKHASDLSALKLQYGV